MIVQEYATQGGGTAYYSNEQSRWEFITVPDWGNFAIGDAVPEEWDKQPMWITSVGAVETMEVTERDGYEAGCANKPDPNPFRADTNNYNIWQAGFDRGRREIEAIDRDAELNADANVCVSIV